MTSLYFGYDPIDGTTIATTELGSTLDGSGAWSKVAEGSQVGVDDFTKDEMGASLIPFASYGGVSGVSVVANATKSFYLTFTESVMVIEESDSMVAEEMDGESSVVGGLQIYNGRKVCCVDM